MIYIYIFLGGGLGASTRHLLSSLVNQWTKAGFPYGTLTVNVLGSFFIGTLLAYMANHTTSIFTHWKALMVTGFLGGFTTFSSFSYETLCLFQQSGLMSALLNIVLNFCLCLIFVYLGVTLVKI